MKRSNKSMEDEKEKKDENGQHRDEGTVRRKNR